MRCLGCGWHGYYAGLLHCKASSFYSLVEFSVKFFFMHIENYSRICYDTDRQNETINPYKMVNENPGAATSGVFCS